MQKPSNQCFLLLLLLLLSTCATHQPARALDAATAKNHFGLTQDTIAPWEDGLRTEGKSGTYEWWYLDAHLDDGSTLVVVFFTKPIIEISGPLAPVVQVDITRPDGTRFSRQVSFEPGLFQASKDRCDVKIGVNRFEGDLEHYTVHLELADLTADLRLNGDVKPWRPGAGILGFGANDEKYFAWLPSVPHGKVTGTMMVEGRRTEVNGSGYHDHNWGNAPLTELVHDWYWGRARVGDYTVIASFITADERYSSTRFPIFLLTKGDEVLVGESSHVTFSSADVHTDEKTGKPIASRLIYDFKDGHRAYRIAFNRKRDLVSARLIDGLPTLTRFFARLAGFDGAYHRFTGDVTVEAFEDGVRTDSQTNSTAVWELMYFGHAPTFQN